MQSVPKCHSSSDSQPQCCRLASTTGSSQSHGAPQSLLWDRLDELQHSFSLQDSTNNDYNGGVILENRCDLCPPKCWFTWNHKDLVHSSKVRLGKCVKWLFGGRSWPGPWSCSSPPTHPQAEYPEGTPSDPSVLGLVETNRPPEGDETTGQKSGRNRSHRVLYRKEKKRIKEADQAIWKQGHKLYKP